MTPELAIIEGFFGRPYSWKERADMVAALQPAGYSFYLYAPKADGYLRRRWRDPYPDAELAALAAFAARCRKLGVRFGVGLSPYELFLGVPVHRVPAVVVESGLASDAYGWVPVNKKTLETTFPGVYAVGDVNGVGTPKAGVFAEGAARVVAAAVIAQLRGGPSPAAYTGAGSCYVEFGHDQVGRVDVDFLSGPKPTGTFQEPSEALAAEKALFGSSRLQRWSDNRCGNWASRT